MSSELVRSTKPKVSLIGKLVTGFIGLCVITILVLKFTNVSNTLFPQIDEARSLNELAVAASKAAEPHVKASDALKDSVLTSANILGVPSTRGEFAGEAQKGITECEAAMAEYRKAAGLLAEASTKRVDEHYQKYLEAKSKQLGIIADIRENLRDQLEMMLDSGEKDAVKLDEKLKFMDVKLADLVRQRNELDAVTEKIKTEHPDVFTH